MLSTRPAGGMQGPPSGRGPGFLEWTGSSAHKLGQPRVRSVTEHLRARLQGARVLVIEDNEQMQRFVERTLGPYDVKTVAVDEGLDGFDQARRMTPDAILLDLGLPDVDGIEVLGLIRGSKRTAGIPVLILTGRSDPSVHAAALEAGADDFIGKPADPRVLVARLANLVGRARAERSNRRLLQQLSRYVSQPARRQGIVPRATERLDATILVSDLRGFTATSFSTDPDAMFQAVSTVLAGQAEIVRHYGGYVDKFSGDGMLAVFGDTAGPHQACAASRAILKWARDSDVVPLWNPIPIGLGIHSGAVLRGDLGSDDRRDHTVLGPAVNIAARLCAVAGPVEAIVSEDVVRAARALGTDRHTFTGIDELRLKGLPGPLPARRLVF